MTVEIGDRPAAPGPRGGSIRAGGKDGPQIIHSKGKRWTDKAEEIFLDSLAASNNATWAAAQCGFSREAIYARARRDPAFAERMAAARALAQGRIDEGLNRARRGFPRRQGARSRRAARGDERLGGDRDPEAQPAQRGPARAAAPPGRPARARSTRCAARSSASSPRSRGSVASSERGRRGPRALPPDTDLLEFLLGLPPEAREEWVRPARLRRGRRGRPRLADLGA